MEKKVKIFESILYIIFGLAMGSIMAGLFYWFQWRPTEIRKDCINYTYLKRDEKINTDDPLSVEEANRYYRRCFAEKGLKPEDLIK